MGSSKDDSKTNTRGSGVHDSTSTSTASHSSSGTGGSSSSGMNSNSGIYDVSRMTNIKSPVDPFGHNVSHFTKVRAADEEKRAKTKSDVIRGLLIALAFPLIAGAIYLAVSGQSLRIPGITDEEPAAKPATTGSTANPSALDRQPAANATLPSILPLEVAPTPPAITTVDRDGHGSTSEAVVPQPLKLEFDSNGQLVSPYTVELNENGDEVARTEQLDRMVFLAPLPLGPFESASKLSKAEVPSSFTLAPQARPFVFSDDERKRVASLRAIAPEVKKYLDESDALSSSRLSMANQAVESFTPDAKLTQVRIDDMFTELRWMRAATISRDISGDRNVERRLLESLMLLARTYKPTGSPITELPLLDALFAYDHVRHLFRTPDQTTIDGFFRDIVDAQFTRMKFEKTYTELHAAHVLFALSVGSVIQNKAFELHGLTQYKFHIDNSKALAHDSYGPEVVRTMNALLHSAYVIERSGTNAYQSARLNQAVNVLFTASQAESKTYLLRTMGVAAYFRPDLYPNLAAQTRAAGIPNSRFGTGEGALLAASRHANASLLPSAINRLPTNAPTKLPAKRR